MSRTEDKPSIVDGKLVRVSASQLTTFKECNLKWYFEKIEKHPRGPTGKGAALGGKLHKEIEDYLLTGVDNRTLIAKKGDSMLEPYIQYMPFKGGLALIEGTIDDPPLVLGDGVSVSGYFDIFIPTPIPVIIDHKFKKNLKAYATKPKELRTDVQATLYGMWASNKTGSEQVEFRHHNHQTQGKIITEPVSVILTRDELVQNFSGLNAQVEQMSACAQDKKLAAPNTASCWNFGGCHFASICPYSPVNGGPMARETLTAGLLRMNNKAPKKEEPEPAPAPVEPELKLDEAPIAILPPDAPEAVYTPPEPEKEKAPKAPKKKAKAPETEPTPIEVSKTSSKIDTKTLLVDVVFTGIAIDATPYIAAALVKLNEVHSVPDIRLANSAELGYGKWKPLIGQLVCQLLAEAEGTIFSVQSSEIVEPVIEAAILGGWNVARGRK